MMARISMIWLAGALWLTGCDEPDTYDLEPESAVAAERATTFAQATASLGRAAAFFEGSSLLAGADEAQTRAGAMALVSARVESVFGPTACAPSVTTDDSTFIDVSFEECTIGSFWRLDGTLRAELALELDAETGDPATLVWTLENSDFGVSTPRRTFPARFVGGLTLRAPVLADAPPSWTSDRDFEARLRGRLFSVRSSISWSVDENECVHIDGDARLQRLGLEPDELEDGVGVVDVALRGMVRCRGACPSAGEGRIAFARGALLEWSYDGSDVVFVTAPRGREFELQLDCEPQS